MKNQDIPKIKCNIPKIKGIQYAGLNLFGCPGSTGSAPSMVPRLPVRTCTVNLSFRFAGSTYYEWVPRVGNCAKVELMRKRHGRSH